MGKSYIRRSEQLLSIVKRLVIAGIEKTSTVNIEMPECTRNMILDPKNSSNGFLYVAPHISLWETLGIPYAINAKGLNIPYVVAANTLISGDVFVYGFKKIGMIVVKVDTKARAKSAINLRSSIEELLSQGESVLIFPDETRSRNGLFLKFKSTAFDAAINSNSIIIPANVDYSLINEDSEYAFERDEEERRKEQQRLGIKLEKKKYTFKALHLTRWIKDHGDIYVSFGAPIDSSALGCNDRRELASISMQACMDLVKIQPINVVSYALLLGGNLEHNVSKVLEKIEKHESKFRGFSLEDTAKTLIAKSSVDVTTPKIYVPYAGRISHYVNI